MVGEATLNVPAPLYDEALAFCNARLADKGSPPITTLPAGRAWDALSCPCAKSCGTVVGEEEWMWANVDMDYKPGSPAGFVRYFDIHATVGYDTLPIRDESLAVPS